MKRIDGIKSAADTCNNKRHTGEGKKKNKKVGKEKMNGRKIRTAGGK